MLPSIAQIKGSFTDTCGVRRPLGLAAAFRLLPHVISGLLSIDHVTVACNIEAAAMRIVAKRTALRR
jgi:hypothetical protein